MLDEFVQALEANGAHWDTASKHIEDFHRQIQTRRGGVQADSQICAA